MEFKCGTVAGGEDVRSWCMRIADSITSTLLARHHCDSLNGRSAARRSLNALNYRGWRNEHAHTCDGCCRRAPYRPDLFRGSTRLLNRERTVDALLTFRAR
jgi:hypothetical protein